MHVDAYKRACVVTYIHVCRDVNMHCIDVEYRLYACMLFHVSIILVHYTVIEWTSLISHSPLVAGYQVQTLQEPCGEQCLLLSW